MAGKPGRSGGKRTPGPDAQSAGRPRQLLRTVDGAEAVVLRNGDGVALHDAHGITEATVSIVDGSVRLVNGAGQSITIMLTD